MFICGERTFTTFWSFSKVVTAASMLLTSLGCWACMARALIAVSISTFPPAPPPNSSLSSANSLSCSARLGGLANLATATSTNLSSVEGGWGIGGNGWNGGMGMVKGSGCETGAGCTDTPPNPIFSNIFKTTCSVPLSRGPIIRSIMSSIIIWLMSPLPNACFLAAVSNSAFLEAFTSSISRSSAMRPTASRSWSIGALDCCCTDSMVYEAGAPRSMSRSSTSTTSYRVTPDGSP